MVRKISIIQVLRREDCSPWQAHQSDSILSSPNCDPSVPAMVSPELGRSEPGGGWVLVCRPYSSRWVQGAKSLGHSQKSARHMRRELRKEGWKLRFGGNGEKSALREKHITLKHSHLRDEGIGRNHHRSQRFTQKNLNRTESFNITS